VDGAVEYEGTIDNVGSSELLGADEGTIDNVGFSEATLLGADDGHTPHVALHVWKTPTLEHFFG